jgi:limonene 1,2-monooxygenase
LQFGIFSNGQRGRPVAADTYDEDLAEIVAADELGFDQAWVSEHLAITRPDVMTDPDLLIAKAAALTSTITLGPAVRVLPLYHPLLVARQAAVCDHLLRGRYMLGVGTGGPVVHFEHYGVDSEKRREMFAQAIDIILRAWTEKQPFAFETDFWSSENVELTPRPFTQPHVPVAFATDTPALIEDCGRRGFVLLTAQYDDPAYLAKKAAAHAAGAKAAGRLPSRSAFTVARHVHVAESTEQAKADIRSDVERHLDYWKTIRFPLAHYLPASGEVADVTFDFLCERGMFVVGDPQHVTDTLAELFHATGGFGTLLIVVGKDWGTLAQRVRSLRLFADHVAPALSALSTPTLVDRRLAAGSP